jgi:hypothetical protein
MRKKISEGLKKAYEEGRHPMHDSEFRMENLIKERDNDYLYENDNIRDGSLISEPQYVEETDRYVRSSWEKDVDLLLHESDIDYRYEPKRFQLENRKYMPDFMVGDFIVEVKGYVGDGFEEKAEEFMEMYPEYEYLVIGTKIPCDTHFGWDEKESAIEYLSEGERSVFDI